MSVRVHRAGILSTLQDRGRYGYQRYGMPVGGVMDEHSHRLANLLVGNAESEATLEFTLAGPRLEFTELSLIAICGGDFAPTIGGHDVPASRPVLVRAGSVLDLAVCRLDARHRPAVRRDQGLHPEADTQHRHPEGEHVRPEGEVGRLRGVTGSG